MPPATSRNGEAFTQFGWVVCMWILLIPFQFGYHISVLNQIQAVLTCKEVSPDVGHTLYGLPTCLPMSDFKFSVVTAVFTAGGLAGSLLGNVFMDRWGRKGAARASSLFVGVGASLMCVSASVPVLGLGRVLVGFGSGIGLCVSPVYLAEIAPSKITGSVGVLTQLGIVLGIMITQAIGLRFATPTQWRSVLFLSAACAVAQFFLSALMVESPTWLGAKGHVEPKKTASRRLWAAVASVEDPLLDELEAHRDDTVTALTVGQVLAAPELRRPLAILSFVMLGQQLSGITVVNAIMTFPPIFLIERMGRRQLLTLSTLGALVSLVFVGFGLNNGFITLSSIAILTFVMSFAIGLGTYSLRDDSRRSSNFLVGLVFLPLRNFLADGDATKEGRVFYIFAVALFLSMFPLSRVYRG
ncbi:hypothetical protein C8R46DRAFT_1158597 [Mycena filopes]|nr:hypothetical protein C8R46DRAFT_1158597 [Mycena filopes]